MAVKINLNIRIQRETQQLLCYIIVHMYSKLLLYKIYYTTEISLYKIIYKTYMNLIIIKFTSTYYSTGNTIWMEA